MKTDLLFCPVLTCLLIFFSQWSWAQNTITPVWAKDYYGLWSAMEGKRIEVDAAGTSYILARTNEGLMNNADDTLLADGGGYILIKEDSSRQFQSAEYLLVNRNWMHGQARMHVSLDGEQTFWGTFHDSIDLAPDTTEQWVYPTGNRDLLVYQRDSSGQLNWLRHFEGKGDELAISIQRDEFDHIFLLGRIRDSLDADPGIGEAWLVPDSGNVLFYVSKLKPDGGFIWAKPILEGPFGSLGAKEMGIGPNGEAYVIGSFLDSLDFDQGPGTTIFDGGNVPDVYFLKLDPNGDFLWARHIGGDQHFEPRDAVVDSDGNLTTMGRMMNEGLDVDPGPDTVQMFFLDQIGGYPFGHRASVLILQLDADGQFQWVRQFTGGYQDEGFILPQQLELNDCDDIYGVGYMAGGIIQVQREMNPSNGEQGIQNLQPEFHNENTFLIRLTAQGEVLWKETLGASGEGNSEFGTDVAVHPNGPIFLLEETVYGSNCVITRYAQPSELLDSVLHVSACQSYLSPSGHYLWDSSGTYHDTIQHCYPDSLQAVVIDLTIGEPQHTLLEFEICQPISLNNQTYANPGTYTQVLTTQAGCDSVLTIQISLEDSLNTHFTQQGGVLIADDPGLTYQWLVCGPNGPVPFPGATHATFATPGPATYALAISNGACQDTSACMDWLTIGLPAIFPTTWQVFPNPSDGWVQIQLDQAYPEVEIRVFDLQGRELSQKTVGGSQQVNVALPEEAGVYLLEVRAGEQRGWKKMVRE
ncbi:MAG: T9SS type A sorting domain-containing protein [Bacteroidota bacterium]